MDVHTPEQRHRNMAAIRGRHTKPEVLVRRLLHAMGYRFRLHCKHLPGCPDIVLPRYKKAIFVNGCFWHRHEGCRYATTPASNSEFWQKKFRENVMRDQANYELLAEQGWRIVVVWECQLKCKDENFLREELKNMISHQ